jgi:hypothetical protein
MRLSGGCSAAAAPAALTLMPSRSVTARSAFIVTRYAGRVRVASYLNCNGALGTEPWGYRNGALRI